MIDEYSGRVNKPVEKNRSKAELLCITVLI